MNPTENDDLTLRRCLDEVGIGVWEYDHVRDRLSYSPVLMQWLGGDFPAAAGSGMADWLARIHPEDRPHVAEVVDKAVNKGEPFAVEYRFAKTGGEWLWLMARGQVQQRDATGRPTHSLGTKTNITERKTEEALFRLQQRFNQVLIDIPDQACLIDAVLDTILSLDALDGGGIYNLRPDGGYELIAARGISMNFISTASDIPPDSPRAALIERAEPVCSCLAVTPGCTDVSLIHQPHIREEGITALLVLPVVVNGKPQGSFNLASKHAASIPVAIKNFLVSLVRQYGQALERLQAKQEALEQRRNLEGFFDALNDFVFVLDDAGLIRHVNPAVRRSLGYGDDLIGRPVLTVHPERVHTEALRVVGEMLAGTRASCPLPLLRADGTELMVDTRVVRGTWNGQPALLGISRDISELHAAQEGLLIRDRYQRAVLDNFPFLVWLKDAESRFLAVNAPFAEACRLDTPERLVGKTDLDIWPADLAERYRADDRQVLESGHAKSIEEPVESDGLRRWYETYKSPVSLDGKVIGTVGFARDITDTVSARDALEKALADLQHERGFLKTLIGTIPDLIWLKDPQGVYLACNPRFEGFFGASEKEIVGKTDYDFVDAELADFFRANDLAAIASAHPRVNEEWVTFACDGHRELLETTKTPMYDSQGTLIGVLGIGHDVTATRNAQRALQEANERRRLLMATSRDGIAIINQDHWIVEANPRFADMLGYAEGELSGLRTWDYDANLTEADVRASFSDLSTINATFESRHRRKDGTIYDVEVSASGTEIDGAKMIITVCRDISERKRVENVLKDSEARFHTLFDNMIEGVALHELITDAQGKPVDYRIIDANQSYETILGINRQAMIGRLASEAYGGSPPYLQDYAEVVAKQRTLYFEPYFEPLGKHFAISVVPWLNYGFATIFNDITERKRTKQALEESNAALQKAQSVAHIGSWSLDMRNAHLLWSDETYRIFGIEIGTPLTLDSFIGCIHEDDREAVLSTWNQARKGADYSVEHRINTPDGIRWVHERAEFTAAADGTLIFAVGTVQDITERKQTERRLQENETRYRTVVDHMTDTLSIIDREGTLHYVNAQSARNLANLPPDQVQGRNIREFVPAEQADILVKHYHHVIDTGEAFIGEIQIELLGQSRWFLNRLTPIRLGAESPPLLMSMSLDISDRKRAEESLRESEARYRVLADYSPDWDYWLGPDGRYHYVSPACERISGYPAQAFLDDPLLMVELIHPDDRHLWREHLHDALSASNQMHEQMILRVRNRDGEERWIEHQCKPIHDAQGRFLGRRGINRDITLRHEAEEALRASEANLRSIIENAADAVFMSDLNGHYIYVNQEACDLLGMSRGELVGASIPDITPEEDSQHSEDTFKLLLETGQVRTELLLKHKQGHNVPVELNAVMLPDGVIFGACRDITERRQAEEALRAREQIFSAIVGQAGDGIALVDGESLIFIEFNDVACQGLGYSREEFAELGIPDIQGGMDPDRVHAVADQLLAMGGGDFETQHRRKDGSLMDVRVSNRAVTISGRRYLAAIWADITERKAKDRELDQHRLHLEELVAERTSELAAATLAAETANKTKSAFLANMSHEIRTPMNAIIGLTHLLRRNNQDARQNERLDKVSDAAQHLLNIINDILDISKIEAGKLAIETTDFEPEKVLSHVVNLMGDKAAEKGLELVLSVEDLPAMLRGDPLRLGQVLLNFVSNAIKFTKRGAIHISGRSVSESKRSVKVHFEVCDTGIGITEEQRSRLFQAFEQADSSTTRRFGGTGLGLVISKRLIELMGGQIGVESQPGIGSRFWIEMDLPRSRKQPKVRRLAHDLRGTRALVVDDNEEAREVLANMLLSKGLDIETATDGHDALERIQIAERAGQPFDLVLLDWHMPGLDGLETARRLKAMSLKAPPAHLMITAYGHRIPRQSLDQTGIEAVLSKPVTPSGLFDVLAEIFDGQRATSLQPAQTAHLEALRTRSGIRILLAEDNAINQEVALALLRDAGLLTDVADNGAEAVEMASKTRYDLILMDVQMPVMDGLAATRGIHALPGYAEVPILAMTANAFTEDRQTCLDAGMCDHVPKPVDPDVLYATLLKWLESAQPRHVPADTAALQPGLDAASPAAPGPGARSLPTDIPGLDTDIGLKSLRGNVASYCSLLCKFANNHDDDLVRLRLMRQNGDHTEARRIAHSLKGAAGALGAVEVQRLAADLETAIRHNVSEEAIQTLTDATEAAQRRLSEALRQRSICAPARPQVSSDDVLDVIARIEALLRADDMAAQEALRDARALLEPALGANLVAISRDIEAFDYAPALEKLQIAAQALRGRPAS